MTVLSKNRIFPLLLIALLTLTGLVASESAYRVFLSYHLAIHLDQQSRKEAIKGPQKNQRHTINTHSYPNVHIYNQNYGFDHYTGTAVRAIFENDKFVSCDWSDLASWSKDSISPEHGEYFDADVKVLFVGSSFTAIEDENGDLATTRAARNLSNKLGQHVVIQNMSRGAYGLLAMADLAKVKIDEYKPDLLILAPNTPDLARPRWWPIFVPDDGGFYRYYQSRVAAPNPITKQNTVLHRYIFSDKLTVEWCEKMTSAMNSGNEDFVSNDSLKKSILRYEEYHAKLREAPKIEPNLLTLNTSFLYNRLRYKDPYRNVDVYKGENPLAGISIRDFTHDAQFMAAWKSIQDSNIPTYILHIPYLPEIENGIEFVGGHGGISKDSIDQLILSIPKFYDMEILSLLPYFKSPVEDPLQFVQSETDWHPNAEGTKIISNGLEDLLLKLFIQNEIVKVSDK